MYSNNYSKNLKRENTKKPEGEKVFENQSGTVKFYNQTKGYGFIVPDNQEVGEDVFFHISGVKFFDRQTGKDLPETDMKVTFDVEKSPKGLVAVNINK